jgi:hypothetical protein
MGPPGDHRQGDDDGADDGSDPSMEDVRRGRIGQRGEE